MCVAVRPRAPRPSFLPIFLSRARVCSVNDQRGVLCASAGAHVVCALLRRHLCQAVYLLCRRVHVLLRVCQSSCACVFCDEDVLKLPCACVARDALFLLLLFVLLLFRKF